MLRRKGRPRRRDVDRGRERRPEGHAERRHRPDRRPDAKRRSTTSTCKKKTYRVTTFAELRKQDGRGAEEDRRKRGEGTGTSRSRSPTRTRSRWRSTSTSRTPGEKKAINGFDTHQVVMTVTVREKGKKLEESGGLVLDLGHVAGAEDCRDEGSGGLRRPLRARRCTGRCSPASRPSRWAWRWRCIR